MNAKKSDIIIEDLLHACRNNNINYVKHIFENNLKEYNYDFQNCVIFAAFNNHDELVKYLFNQHINNIKFISTNTANTALYHSIRSLNLDLIEFILNTNICDLDFSDTMLNNILNTFLEENETDAETIINLKEDIFKKLIEQEEFLKSVIYRSIHNYIPFYIKKYLFYNNIINFDEDHSTHHLLFRTIIDISIINDVDFLNDIISKYDISSILQQNSNILLHAVNNNNVEILRILLTYDSVDNHLKTNESLLYSIDFYLEYKQKTNIIDCVNLLLEDGRILYNVRCLINNLNDNFLDIVMKYYNIESKTKLKSIFNFF